MGDEKSIFLVRHGEQVYDPSVKGQAEQNNGLTFKGVIQIMHTALALQCRLDPTQTLIISSDLTRTQQTAGIISLALFGSMHSFHVEKTKYKTYEKDGFIFRKVKEGLRERYFGNQLSPDLPSLKIKRDTESKENFSERITQVWAKCLTYFSKDPCIKNLVIVSHSHVMKAILYSVGIASLKIRHGEVIPLTKTEGEISQPEHLPAPKNHLTDKMHLNHFFKGVVNAFLIHRVSGRSVNRSRKEIYRLINEPPYSISHAQKIMTHLLLFYTKKVRSGYSSRLKEEALGRTVALSEIIKNRQPQCPEIKQASEEGLEVRI